MFLMYTLCLPVNKPSPNNRPHNGYKDAPKKITAKLSSFLFSFEWLKKFAQKLSFYIIFTKNILSAESVADSPRSGCEAATRCTKTYTVSFL